MCTVLCMCCWKKKTDRRRKFLFFLSLIEESDRKRWEGNFFFFGFGSDRKMREHRLQIVRMLLQAGSFLPQLRSNVGKTWSSAPRVVLASGVVVDFVLHSRPTTNLHICKASWSISDQAGEKEEKEEEISVKIPDRKNSIHSSMYE